MNVESTLTDLENPVDQRNLVAFRLEQQTYALPIEPVAQIIEMVTITPIPQVNRSSMEGVINVRGATVPVVNLGRHLGLPEAPLQLHTPLILIQTDGRMVGLIVDEVIDVLNLPADQIARPADFLPEGLGGAPILQGLAHTPDGMVLLLDPDHLFLPSQVQALVQAMETLPGNVDEQAVEEAAVELPVETPPEIVVEEASEESPMQTQPEVVVEEAAEETPVETQPQPTRRRRKKRERTKKATEETPLDEPAQEVEA